MSQPERAPVHDQIGRAELYTPERLLTTWTTTNVHFPPGLPAGLTFPVHPSAVVFDGLIPLYQSRPINHMHLRTVDRAKRSAGKLPQTVEELDLDARLRRVQRCCVLWDNLKSYADPSSETNTWTVARNAVDAEDPLRLPSAHQQARAITQLLGWSMIQSNRPEPLANCEMVVQDHTRGQVVEPLDMLLQVGQIACLFRRNQIVDSFPLCSLAIVIQ